MALAENLTAVFGSVVAWFVPALFALIGILFFGAPASRKRLAAAGLLSVAGVGGLLLLGVLHRLWASPPAGYRVLQGLSHFLLVVGAVNAGGVLAFDILLPALRISLPALVQDLLLAAGYIVAGLTVLSHAGADLSGILATSAVVTAVVAFSLQDTLGNVMGGMVLHFESSFAPGDWIRFGPDEGVVREIRWRQTTLDTGDGDLVVIPNSALMKGTVTVLGRGGRGERRRVRKVPFNVYYDRAPNEAISVVERSLREDPPANVASEPPPSCVLEEIRESHAVYAALYWLTDLASPGSTDSAVRTRLYYALSRAGMKLSIPARAVVVIQKDEDVREEKSRLETERRLAALRGVDLFQSLTPDELALLAGRLQAAPFASGELITRQGAESHCLYIVVQGEAEVRLVSPDGGAFQLVGMLRPGDLLGEMGLMTGERRSATVVASSEMLCYRLDSAAFADILARRPEIAESISLILARRKVELEAARGGLDEEVRRQGSKTEQGDLLSRIRGLFSLR